MSLKMLSNLSLNRWEGIVTLAVDRFSSSCPQKSLSEFYWETYWLPISSNSKAAADLKILYHLTNRNWVSITFGR